MHPAIIPALGALGGFLGQSSANRTNVRLAREQMAFQERMSNTSYQRAMKDMEQAGINPMLAFAQGGAQSPGGSIARTEDAIGPAVSSAQGARRLTAELDLLRQQALESQARTQQTTQTTQRILPLQEAWQRAMNMQAGFQTEQIRLGLAPLRREAALYDSPAGGALSLARQIFGNVLSPIGLQRRR